MMIEKIKTGEFLRSDKKGEYTYTNYRYNGELYRVVSHNGVDVRYIHYPTVGRVERVEL